MGRRAVVWRPGEEYDAPPAREKFAPRGVYTAYFLIAPASSFCHKLPARCRKTLPRPECPMKENSSPVAYLAASKFSPNRSRI